MTGKRPPKKFSIWRVIRILLLILALGMLIWYGISKLTKKVPAPHRRWFPERGF